MSAGTRDEAAIDLTRLGHQRSPRTLRQTQRSKRPAGESRPDPGRW